MFLYIITWTVIYSILILLLHNLYLFFQKNLTTTKTKDYYNFPNKEYNKINNILNSDIKLPEKKVKNNDISTNSKIGLDSKLTTFSNIDFSLTSNDQYNNDAKIFPNYDVNLTTKNVETALEKDSTFDLEKFNSQFENNNMKGELEEFLNKLNN
jgi:hypothetical protein|tara:strand:+ start:937 stop:1398 length:462 start_codon:yes stop_codon:yes gene_type:complete